MWGLMFSDAGLTYWGQRLSLLFSHLRDMCAHARRYVCVCERERERERVCACVDMIAVLWPLLL